MATLATGLPARFGRAGLAPAGLHQGVSPPHLRFLLFQAFPSAITTPAVSRVFLSFFFRISLNLSTASSTHGLRLFLPLLFIGVTLICPARLRSSTQCCPPNISSITVDHDELFELPVSQGRRSLITRSVTFRTIPRFWHLRTRTTAFLLLLSTTTELVVLNLIPQHDPQPDPELASYGHARLPQTFLD